MQKYNLAGGKVSISEICLMVALGISVLLMFLFQFFHYKNLLLQVDELPPYVSIFMALCIGTMFQLTRFGFAMSGVVEFATGRTKAGAVGLLFSIALSVFETFEVIEIARDWIGSGQLQTSFLMIVQAIVWISFFLEIRLAIFLGRSNKKSKSFSSNGAAKNSRSNNGQPAYN